MSNDLPQGEHRYYKKSEQYEYYPRDQFSAHKYPSRNEGDSDEINTPNRRFLGGDI